MPHSLNERKKNRLLTLEMNDKSFSGCSEREIFLFNDHFLDHI